MSPILFGVRRETIVTEKFNVLNEIPIFRLRMWRMFSCEFKHCGEWTRSAVLSYSPLGILYPGQSIACGERHVPLFLCYGIIYC